MTPPPHDPISTLGQSLGKVITIKCKRQKIFKGFLRSYDAHLNVLMEEVEYTYNKKSEEEEGAMELQTETIDKIILRGDSIVFIGLAA